MTVHTELLPSADIRLQRHIVHDDASRSFPADITVDKSTWRSHTLRTYDPRPNPNQTTGNCTAVSKCVQFNTAGNRDPGIMLDMDTADKLYVYETHIDPFPGQMPAEDTGSNGLAAAKAAVHFGLGGTYLWLFNGADEVIQAVLDGEAVSVGTAWYEDMFYPDARGKVTPGGPLAGGHQWTVRGFDFDHDEAIGRCWWGDFRDFRIDRGALDELLADQGDAHIQRRN